MLKCRQAHTVTHTQTVWGSKLWLLKANTVSYSKDQLYGCQKTLKQSRYKALMVSPLLYVTEPFSNGFIIGLWVSLCKHVYSNASKLCVLANPFLSFPSCVFEKQTLSQSRTRSLSLCHRGNICCYIKPAFILITFTCSNSLSQEMLTLSDVLYLSSIWLTCYEWFLKVIDFLKHLLFTQMSYVSGEK